MKTYTSSVSETIRSVVEAELTASPPLHKVPAPADLHSPQEKEKGPYGLTYAGSRGRTAQGTPAKRWRLGNNMKTSGEDQPLPGAQQGSVGTAV